MRLRTSEPSFDDSSTMSASPSLRLIVCTGEGRSPRGRRNREGFREVRLLLVRREIAPVVGRTLLVAERQEALLQIALERPDRIPQASSSALLRRRPAAANDALAQCEQCWRMPSLPYFASMNSKTA